MPFSKKQKSIFGFLAGLVLMVAIAGAGYIVTDQAFTITYMQDGYKRTEEELAAIVCIVNTTNFSKRQIEKCVRQHPFFEYVDFSGDTVVLQRYELIFRNNRLFKIVPM
ncbi:hypothetical protein ACN9ML_28070 [Dyadobacter endophyticus]|uniref:Uncharacterized protein n=1 Tax=Dyadobacter endophyticus TaxID=1749036 RepID=A0ABQ1YTP7_9BACT|nr:hypothetical protein [Dyadobacter endophyticus]GGH38115.1 hypothetical protein GCM10007423_31590 [Dyadobacter endophyticus]